MLSYSAATWSKSAITDRPYLLAALDGGGWRPPARKSVARQFPSRTRGLSLLTATTDVRLGAALPSGSSTTPHPARQPHNRGQFADLAYFTATSTTFTITNKKATKR
jgi:hypothetical protein